jgi:hypothetical protein
MQHKKKTLEEEACPFYKNSPKGKKSKERRGKPVQICKKWIIN